MWLKKADFPPGFLARLLRKHPTLMRKVPLGNWGRGTRKTIQAGKALPAKGRERQGCNPADFRLIAGCATADGRDEPLRVAKRLSERERHWRSLIGQQKSISAPPN
jgi:hypothetical protein